MSEFDVAIPQVCDQRSQWQVERDDQFCVVAFARLQLPIVARIAEQAVQQILVGVLPGGDCCDIAAAAAALQLSKDA